MKSFFHKILAISLALLVLGSTTSFVVNMHYCGKHLVDVSLFKAAKTCGMEMKTTTTPQRCSIEKPGCCSDKQLIVNGQQELKQSLDQITFQNYFFAVTFYYTYLNLFKGLDQQIVPFKDYSPPLLIKDIHILDETYLI